MVEACTKGGIVVGLVKYFSVYGVGEGYQKYEAWLNRLTMLGDNFTDIYKECSIPSACWMTTREDFEQVGGVGNRYPEDYDLAFRFYRRGLKLLPVPSVLHHWRDHAHRASRNDPNYSDNRFLDLKIDYFLEVDFTPPDKLGLIGAGAKGKMLAAMLRKKGVEFDWFTNNPKKIGVNIYGKILKSDSEVSVDNLICAVAGEEGDRLRNRFPEATFFC